MPIGIAPTRFDSYGLPDLGYLKGVAEGANGTFQSITAKASGTQANATPMASNALMVYIGTVATAGDSVMLNFAVAGRTILVANAGANNVSIYANPAANKVNNNALDTINGASNSTAYKAGVIAPNTTVIFFAPANGKWVAISGS